MAKKDDLIRCEWCGDDPLYVEYHDREWGKLVTSDEVMFEFLVLESAQAGLSWITILRRREGYRKAFMGFDVTKVANMTQKDVERLMLNSEIIRNRLKIESTITNAQLFKGIQEEFGSFCNFLQSFFTDGVPLVNSPSTMADVAASTPMSDAISKEMKRRGFKFFGTTICYAFLQAVGYVDDHIMKCNFKGR